MTFQEKVLARSRAAKKVKTRQSVSEFLFAFLLVILLGVGGWRVWAALHPGADSATKMDAAVVSDDPPPTDLLINGEAWKVWAFDYDDAPEVPRTRQAQTECERRDIFYDAKRIHSRADFRATLWHEIVHAGFCQAKSAKQANWAAYTKDAPEHGGVYQLGMFLPGFVHDNPEFMKWAEDWK